MKRFSELGIDKERSFVGTKLSVDDILNTEIAVEDYRIEDSTKKPGTKYLQLQIKIDQKQHVVFTGSGVLMNQIEKASELQGIPFLATIIKVNKHYEFN